MSTGLENRLLNRVHIDTHFYNFCFFSIKKLESLKITFEDNLAN